MIPRLLLGDVLGARRLTFLPALLTLLHLTSAQSPSYVTTTNSDGQTVYLLDDREPALYTGQFGDCLGGSLLGITRFNAAYYQDNMTITFALEGSSSLSGLSTMVYIGVYAYGENRFEQLLNPCGLGINGLCPTNSSVPVELEGIIPVSASEVSGIPPIALNIPDFEGQAMLRLFSNETQSEIGCYSAVITNGNSFSHPSIAGTIVGIFTFVALIASFATVVYGDHAPTTRTHYAHSMSVFVIFAVFHHIFFTGALSMNWPSVLPAFWSNFAWTAGMIYTPSMFASINNLLGVNTGNTSVVGAASLGSSSDGTGGGYELDQIYKRASDAVFGREPMRLATMMELMNARGSIEGYTSDFIEKRAIENATNGFIWYGAPVEPGLPLPGNFSGFAGTLSEVGIPAGQAFMTGFLWLIILLVVVVSSVVLFKWALEGLTKAGWVRWNTLEFFRSHWKGFAAQAGARVLFIAFFMMMFLTMFQFVYKGSAGVTAIAVLVFLAFLIGMPGIAGLACYYRLHDGHFVVEKHRPKAKYFSSPFAFPKLRYVSHDSEKVDVHDDEGFIYRYGWLAARYKKETWWFFSFWLAYEFIRACFYGGAAGQPMVQVFGLLAVEIIAFVIIIRIKPFEGNRTNILMVYLLGFSKVASVALSSAFNPAFGIQRIEAAAIGIVIIVIQGFLIIAMLILIILGAMSTRMSLTRNREISPDAEDWAHLRARYFQHIENTSGKRAPTPAPALEGDAGVLGRHSHNRQSHFELASVRRVPKIEDEDDHEAQDFDPYGSRISVIGDKPGGTAASRRSRANSMHSVMSNHNLPFGARPHRESWSSRDFSGFYESQRGSAFFESRRNSGIASPGGSGFDNLRGMRSQSSLREGYPSTSRTGKNRVSSGSGKAAVRPMMKNGSGLELERIPTEGEGESQEGEGEGDSEARGEREVEGKADESGISEDSIVQA